jgi:hypothetical protein
MGLPPRAPDRSPRWPMLLVILAAIAGIATAAWLAGVFHFG